MDSAVKVVLMDSSLPSKCFELFRSMRQNKEFCDIIMNFGNHSISAHRVILFAAFPRLKEILGRRDGTGGRNEATVPIEPSALAALIDFAYSCELEVTSDNVEDLLFAAVYCEIDYVQEACCDLLSKQLSHQNVMKRLELAESLGCTALVGSCHKFIREHFDEVSMTEDFMLSPLSFVTELISRDDLSASCEEKVFEAVMRWVRKRPEERNDDLPELLSRVRLTHVNPEYLLRCISMQEEIRTSMVCRDLVDDAKHYHFMPVKMSQIYTLVTRPRKKMPLPTKRKRTQSGIESGGIYAISKCVTLKMQHLDFRTRKWKTLETLPFCVRSGSTKSVGDNVYFIDGGFLRSCAVESMTWIPHDSFMIDQFFAGSAVLNNKLYICGGRGTQNCLDTVACLDLLKDEVVSVPSMSEARSLPGVVALQGYLYVLGGYNGFFSMNSVEQFDPMSKMWIQVWPMRTDRFGMGCTEHNKKIYVCGGYSTTDKKYLNSAEVYDPVQGHWQDISPMTVGRYQCSLVSDGVNLYAIGGSGDGDISLNSVEIYNSETNEWTFGPSTDPSQQFVQAVAVG